MYEVSFSHGNGISQQLFMVLHLLIAETITITKSFIIYVTKVFQASGKSRLILQLKTCGDINAYHMVNILVKLDFSHDPIMVHQPYFVSMHWKRG